MQAKIETPKKTIARISDKLGRGKCEIQKKKTWGSFIDHKQGKEVHVSRNPLVSLHQINLFDSLDC
jgi:hypothetical protein